MDVSLSTLSAAYTHGPVTLLLLLCWDAVGIRCMVRLMKLHLVAAFASDTTAGHLAFEEDESQLSNWSERATANEVHSMSCGLTTPEQ